MTTQERVQTANKERQVSSPATFRRAALLRWLPAAIIAGLSVWMTIAWGHLIGTVVRYYSPLPFWDYWDTVTRWQLLTHHDLVRALWDQHNEHRMVFPNLIFDADYWLFAGREKLPLVLNVVFYFCVWAVLSAAVFMSRTQRYVSICAALLAGILMAWEGAALEVGGAFLVQWPLMLVFSAAALFLLGTLPGTARPRSCLAAAIGCAVVANYSAANGLFFWPILLLAAWVLRLSKVSVAILAVSAAFFSALYFVGYQFTGQTNFAALLRHPVYSVDFTAAYLGSPFTVVAPWFGVVVGFGIFAGVVAFAVIAVRRGLARSRVAVVLFGVYLLCVVTALLTTVGRMNPKDLTFGAATAQRYIITPLIADSCLLLLSAWLFANRRTLVATVASMIFVFSIYRTDHSHGVRDWLEFPKYIFRRTQLVSAAAQSGIADSLLLTNVYPGAQTVKEGLVILRENHLSVFATGRANWLGKPALSVVHLVSYKQLPGAVTHVFPIRDGLVVAGWTDSPRSIWAPQQLVFLNERQIVVGLGEKLPGGMPRDFASMDTPQGLAWVGFVNLDIPSTSYTAFVVNDRRVSLSRVGNTLPVPAIRIGTAEETGPVIAGIRWHPTGSWVEKGVFSVRPSKMPAGIDYYESWNGSDANVGSIRSEAFPTPAGNCVVLNGANGPSIDDLSETLVDADTGQVIASVPLESGNTNWHYWTVLIPSGVRNLRLQAEDNGQGWGEWLVIGEPRSCK